MKKVISFLSDLHTHNDRVWFEANKGRYREALEQFNAFAERLIAAIGGFDPATRGLRLADCTYRIYRDVRFSHDKSPYKNHMGIYVCPGGKKSGNAGYYFHVEPLSAAGGPIYFMTAGLYMPEPRFLKSIREEMLDNGEGLLAMIRQAKGFRINEENKLKRTPTGYPAATPMDEYLKLKDVYIEQAIDEKTLLRDDLAEWAAAEFKKTYPFNALLNKAVDYAREENV
jgi:uncharacterized protein (TIGR02453 family)